MSQETDIALWLYDTSELRKSPSILDGIDIDSESRYRREGARFIMNVGTKMGLLYDTMATAVVYFHRFYMIHSFKRFSRYPTACCCLFLSGKVEETPKKCKDLIKMIKTILTASQFAEFGDAPEEDIVVLERILLKTIKFDLQIDHPYQYLLTYAKCLIGDKTNLQKMVQMAWTFINDSLCTTLCLQWEPEIIAIALMYLAGKLSKFEVVDWLGRTSRHLYWWDMYVEGMSIQIVEEICHQILDLYSAPISSSYDSPQTKSSVCISQQTQNPSLLTPPPAFPPKSNEMVGQPIPRIVPGCKPAKPSKVKSGSKIGSRHSACSFQGLPKLYSNSEHESYVMDFPPTGIVRQCTEPLREEAVISQPMISTHLKSSATSGQHTHSYKEVQEFTLLDPAATYFPADSSFFSPPSAQNKIDSENFMTLQTLPSAAPLQPTYSGSSPPSQMHPVYPEHSIAPQYSSQPLSTNVVTNIPPLVGVSQNMMPLSSNKRMEIPWKPSHMIFPPRMPRSSLNMLPMSRSELYHINEQAVMNRPPELRAPITGGRGGSFLWEGPYQGCIGPRPSFRRHQMPEYPVGEHSNNEDIKINNSTSSICNRQNTMQQARGAIAQHMTTPTGIPSVRVTGRPNPYEISNTWWEDY